MMTVRQLLVVTGQNPLNTMNTNPLKTRFSARPLSLRSVISGYEKQRFVLFVTLTSINIFRSHTIRSEADLVAAAESADGRLDGPEVLDLSSRFRDHGLSLRLVDNSLRKAAIVGTALALVNVPAIPLTTKNLLHIQDKSGDLIAIGSGIAIIGGVVVAVGTATAPITIPVAIAAGVTVGAGAFIFGVGIGLFTENTPPTPRSDSPESTPTLNDSGLDAPSEEMLEIPNAVAVGTPPEGFNTDGVLQQLSDFSVNFSVDLVLSDLPVGFDPGTGAGLPGIPGGDGGAGGDTDGGGFPIDV